MSSSTIQFHAAPAELRTLAQWIAGAVDCTVVCEEFPPSRAFLVPITEIAKTFENEKFLQFKFVIGVTKATETNCEPDDVIHFGVERPANNQLRQSSVGIISDKPAVLKAWKLVSGHVRKMTSAGVKVTNPGTKASMIAKGFRFTAGAKELADKGMTMMPSAGSNVITFET